NASLPDVEGNSLLEAGEIYIVLNPFNLIKNDHTIERLDIEEATIRILFDEHNKSNFQNLIESTGEESENDSLSNLSLNAISLTNVRVDYINLSSGMDTRWQLEKVKGEFQLVGENYIASVEGGLSLLRFNTTDWQSDTSRDFAVDLSFRLDDNTRILTFENSSIDYSDAEFSVTGTYAYQDDPGVDIEVKGDNLTFGLVSDLLSDDYKEAIEKYKSTGTINFTSQLKGEFREGKKPALNAKLEFIDVDLKDQQYQANIEDLNAITTLQITNLADMKTGSFQVKSAQGSLQNEPFSFTMGIKDFNDPTYTGHFNATITTGWLLSAIKYPYHKSAEGNIKVDLRYSGKPGNANIFDHGNTRGIFELNDVSFNWSDTISVDRISGKILVDKYNVDIQNVVLEWLESNAVINGSIQGLGAANRKADESIVLRSNIRSGILHVEDILALIDNYSFTKSSETKNDIDLELVLSCQFDELEFRRYHGKRVTGDLMWQGSVLEVTDLNGQGMGGMVNINGLIKVIPSNKDYYIEAEAVTDGVLVDSMFYVFENFQQDWIVDNHLKGQLFAEISTSMYFDSTWRFRRKLLQAEGKLKAVEGELNNFEPIMELSSYIDDKEDNLSKLRFSDLVNYVSVRNDTVFIPEMSIHTNVRNIALGGYHTLDQHIYYQLVVPVINERVDKDEVFGAVKKSSKGVPNLLFVIKGTADDYSVNYDLKRATENVLNLLDITKIFKNKEEESIDSTFLEDEEFDWEN
ncbi:MAG: AsmA-like C-terminal region-containing protein, partial [Bacteroidota bacterium]